MFWARLLITLVVALFAACAGCSDVDKKGDPFPTTEGDAGPDAGDIGGRDMDRPDDVSPDAPQIVVEPGALEFVDVPVGASAEQTVSVRNAGEGTLDLLSVTLVETTSSDGTEFEPGNQWSTGASLESGDSITLSVRYTPQNTEGDIGYIEILSNDPAGMTRVELTSRAAATEPNIAAPPAITFQRVPPVDVNTRDETWQVFEVRNIGGAPLALNDVLIVPFESDFSFSFPPTIDAPPSADLSEPPPLIDPGDSLVVRVFFNPSDTLPSTAELVFFTNDPDSPETIVELAGNTGAPCMELSEETQIDFGTGAVGFTTSRTIVVENCSSEVPLQITDFDVCTNDTNGACSAGGAFGVNVGTLGASGMIAPSETATLVVSFSPVDLVMYSGELSVSSDDPAKPTIVVPLAGVGTDGNACPQAIADARVSGTTAYTTNLNALPLQTVELRGTNSTDPDGTIASYQWTIVQRPVNSTAVLTPANDVASPQLFLDLAGTYVLELQVTDDDNAVNCGTQALVRITAVPDEDIHVQLVWDTPADSNQSDANGTDLDLHFLHPNGEWNNAPWDIYWLNPTADWGVSGPDDDPSLDIDDTDGAGPENINMNQPQAGLSYAIGAYYYSDNGYGPSYATIRVFIDGVLEYEYRDLFMQTTASFWYAATVSWPSGDVLGINNVTTGFP